jgi:hypothetical protein
MIRTAVTAAGIVKVPSTQSPEPVKVTAPADAPSTTPSMQASSIALPIERYRDRAPVPGDLTIHGAQSIKCCERNTNSFSIPSSRSRSFVSALQSIDTL